MNKALKSSMQIIYILAGTLSFLLGTLVGIFALFIAMYAHNGQVNATAEEALIATSISVGLFVFGVIVFKQARAR